MFEEALDRTSTPPSPPSDIRLPPSASTPPEQTAQSITLVVAGRLFRDCLEHVLKKVTRFQIHACESLAEIGQPGAPVPNLLVCHIDAADNNVEIFHRIRRLQNQYPSVRYLIVRREASLEFVRDAVTSGIHGILLEDSPEDTLRLAVETILLGYCFVPVELSQLLANETPVSARLSPLTPPKFWTNPRAGVTAPASDQRATTPASFPFRHWHLSSRETQILHCLEKGQSNKLIARELDIAEATVKVHVQALLRKMNVTNRTQAAMAARNFLGSSSGTGRVDILVHKLDVTSSVDRQTIQESTTHAAKTEFLAADANSRQQSHT